jgi:oligopeptide/dipeptide ABC transporter ATP-binding protein
MPPLLSVQNLSVAFPHGEGWVAVLRQLSLSVEGGEFVGLVGESGSGKTLTALAIVRLLPEGGRILGGTIELAGDDLLGSSEEEMRRVRGGRISMVFQEPTTALNPVFTIGFQVAEAVKAHRGLDRRQAWREAGRLLDLVAIPAARQRLRDYPHQISGGQRQRVMLAMALAAHPDLLVADEPTTALDVTVQAQILELLETLRRELGLAILLITHDLAVVAETCQRVFVMYAGEVVEEATSDRLFAHPAHPYTRGLLAALPRLGRRSSRGSLPTIAGRVPDPGRLPEGCSFHPRCAEVLEICCRSEPPVVRMGARHRARCFLHRDVPPTPGCSP